MFYQHILRPILFSMDPEKAHDLAMKWAIKANESDRMRSLIRIKYHHSDKRLEQELLGLRFANPVGIAAGFDKNGKIIKTLEALGFGFVEIGSITARPSKGNPKPRMFRLPSDQAVINRMGLNNDGADVIIDRLDKEGVRIPVGINIAKTHDPNILGDKAIDDYIYSFLKAEEKADYIMVNISCPNTAEGITFEQEEPLRDLLSGIVAAQRRPEIPVLVKFSPDITIQMLESLVGISLQAGVKGFAISNTSTSRNGLHTSPSTLASIGRGGLSGRPLRDKVENLTRKLRAFAGNNALIIGIGGIDGPQTAIDRLKSGAQLAQVYTGLIYRGPALPSQINRELVRYLDASSLKNAEELRAYW